MNKAVVFDVGRVLFDWHLEALFKKIIGQKEELEWFLNHVITEEWHFQHDRGRALSEMVEERISEYPDYEPHLRAYQSRFNETITDPIAGVHELVHRLSEAGVALYCLTNFGDEFWNMFRPTKPIFDLFADIIVSGTEKVAKPEARIYQIVEERAGLKGANLFFTDDNPANISAAKERGWDAHLFTDAIALEEQLKRAQLL